MAFETLTTAQIQAGKPTAQELFRKLKNSLDDHESRLITVESAVNQLPPISFDIVGTLNSPTTMDGVLHYRVNRALNLLAVRLFVVTAGTAGTLTVDVEYKRGAGAWTSVLDAPISAGFGSGDLYVTSGAIAVSGIHSGDILRLNIDSVQTEMTDFSVYLENEVG